MVVQTRNQNKAQKILGDSFAKQISFVTDFAEWAKQCNNAPVDYGVVNLAGAPIADARWSKRRKLVLEDSRVALTKNLVQQIAENGNWPKMWLNASAIGFYGSGKSEVDESAPAGDGYASELCRKWEETLKDLPESLPKAVMRFGVVLGNGGALKKLLPMFKCGVGGPIGDGQQGFSWVHIDDVVGAIMWLLESALSSEIHSEIYNVTSPNPVSQKEFAQALAKQLHRPSFMPTPAWVLRAVFGDMAQELLIEGQFVKPTNLISEGFQFKYPDLESALKSLG